jgi:hypothetical protein
VLCSYARFSPGLRRDKGVADLFGCLDSEEESGSFCEQKEPKKLF